MAQFVIRKNDELMMSLVHYFVTKENYSPIRVQGATDEIWLENLDGPYRVIRINSNSIINEEQFEYDILKLKNILHQIKKKTLSFNVNALNICLDIDGGITVDNVKNVDTINATSLNAIKNDEVINKAFPKFNKEVLNTNNGLDLIIKVTSDINAKTDRDNKAFNKVFSPKKIICTNIIILLCIVMYLVSCYYSNSFLNISANVLAYLGGNNILLVKSGEIYRLLTSAFLHAGLVHLIVNMYSLAILGSQVESFLGKAKFLVVYLVSALSGSLMSLVFSEANIVSVGASGAIFGLMGALLYFGYHYRMYLSNAIKTQLIPIIVINLLIGVFVSGVDLACHIGGLIGGFITAIAVGVDGKSKRSEQINGFIVLLIYIVFLSLLVFLYK